MADSVIATQPVTNPPTLDLDAERLAGAGPSGQDIYRERVQIAGSVLAQIAAVLNAPPLSDDYGLVVRPINTDVGSLTNQTVLQQILVTLQRIETHLASITDEELTANNGDGDGELATE